jgi:DegV family protein with EDD domain
MPAIKILTDSTTYLPSEWQKEYDVTIVPLNINWGETSYRDGIDMTPTAFYERLVREKELPKTSQPSQELFNQTFLSLAEDASGIVAPLISSGISGTVENAQAIACQFNQIPIEIIDTHNTSAGQTLIVREAGRVASQGGSLQEVKHAAESVAGKLYTYFVVDTLEYLHRGGRIGGASRYFGAALNIKPILTFNAEGEIDALERVRTKQKALQRLIALAEEKSAGRPVKMGVMEANAPQVAAEFCQQMTQKVDCEDLFTIELSPVIGAHVGPGTIGISFYIV